MAYLRVIGGPTLRAPRRSLTLRKRVPPGDRSVESVGKSNEVFELGATGFEHRSPFRVVARIWKVISLAGLGCFMPAWRQAPSRLAG